MILSSMNIYLVTLFRYKTASMMQIHVEAKSELQALIYAVRIAGNSWEAEVAEKVDAPCYAYEEYNGYKIWEEDEDGSENMRKFYHVLPPNSLNCLCPTAKNRSELVEFISGLENQLVSLT